VRVKADWSLGSPENTVRFATMMMRSRARGVHARLAL